MSWNEALRTFCDLYTQSQLTNPWIIVGSVGSVLQKARIEPNDLDIYVRNREDVIEMAQLLKEFNRKGNLDPSKGGTEWFSSSDEPYMTQTFASGFTWTKGKWIIQDFPVEVVQISNSAGIPDSDSGDGIWEGGKSIWDNVRYVEFGKYEVPVVPLEIQLESNMRRQRQDRIDAILDALIVNGYDKELLIKAVSDVNKEHSSLIQQLLA